MLPLLPILSAIAPPLIGGIIGGVVTFAVCCILDRKKIKEMQKNNNLSKAIKCAIKNSNSVTFEDLENGKKYEVKCDGVSDDISVGDHFIYA